MVTSAARCTAAAYARNIFGLSERGACPIVEVARRVIRYWSRRSDHVANRARMREFAAQCSHFGRRRLGVLIVREGIWLNRKKLFRIYLDEGLKVHRRGARERAMGIRAPRRSPRA